MSLYGTNKFKAFYGAEKVKAIMYGETKVWSGASEVTRYVRGVAQPILEVEDGQNVASALPVPTVANATFVGWATESGVILPTPSLIANGDPMSVYAIFDYKVIADGVVNFSEFITNSNCGRGHGAYGDNNAPWYYGGSWSGEYNGDAGKYQAGSFSKNFTLSADTIGMKCNCDLFAYSSGRGNWGVSSVASISNVGTLNGAWQSQRRYTPEFIVADNTRTFSFSGSYTGISQSWQPLVEAGCVSLTLRGN